ncbi:MAG: hypothetical protein KatS3mg065_0127 [Chloroflexota bacterium]|nr:MAG: hypothetical protein KatS3mg065_0127 [Chloroflexota bacterium]
MPSRSSRSAPGRRPAALLVAVGWLGGGLLCLVARPGARDLGRVGLVFLGVGLALGRTALGAEAPTPPLPTGDGPWVGVVEAVGSSRDGRQRVVVSLEPDGPAVLLDLPPEPRLGPADVIRFDGRLELPPPTAYGDYLRRSGLAGSATAQTSERMGRRESPAALLATARTAAADALARTIPEPEAGLAAGILVGLRERVDRGVAADFATAGLSHIVAISGWNIAIVGAAVATLARRAGRVPPGLADDRRRRRLRRLRGTVGLGRLGRRRWPSSSSSSASRGGRPGPRRPSPRPSAAFSSSTPPGRPSRASNSRSRPRPGSSAGARPSRRASPSSRADGCRPG